MTDSKTYQATSHAVTVSATPYFVERESTETAGHYIWAYQIRIENQSNLTFQLRRRYWRVIDNQGKAYEVSGEGVVGEQPILKPGEQFEYTSATPLQSPSGIMEGKFYMEDTEGKEWEINVPTFSLDSPYQKIILN